MIPDCDCILKVLMSAIHDDGHLTELLRDFLLTEVKIKLST